MSRPAISAEVRRRVDDAAGRRCGYCLTPESIVAMPMEIDHIVPASHGGSSDDDNLWLACNLCNKIKSDRTFAVDEETNREVPFFDPRRQKWSDHFDWSQDGSHVIGRTPIGRATVKALRLNRDVLVTARRHWVAAGWHPPPLEKTV